MKTYKLNVDPRILELLGPNLYTNIYYVLAELIANAYDADASNVYITTTDDSIRVEDDGHGMSYKEGDIDRYLNVAGVSRTTEEDSLTRSRTRRRMGRKGVGKLAALSVSENVDVLTIANGEKSGFVLSRRPKPNNELEAIPEDDIGFERIDDHGSAIIMRQPQYRLHKTLAAVKRNLLKIFPLVDHDFQIHIAQGNEHATIEDFDRNVMEELSTLITLGKSFQSLADLVPNAFPDRRTDLVDVRAETVLPVTVRANDGVEREYSMAVHGWIGTYKSTRGRKAERTDFPDNFISLFANGKLGEFNILPIVGQNKLNEVYVVGQLHIDLFELTELPDMALSNRQGYKSDDPRYEAAVDYVRKDLLAAILRSRELFADLHGKERKRQRAEHHKHNEEKLREQVDSFRKKASETAASRIMERAGGITKAEVEDMVSRSINDNVPEFGLKTVVDAQKKKILISQTQGDKPLADIIYQMLLHNNVPPEDILYTSCDDEVCRIPEGEPVYRYLREFFVESYSNQKIYVVFVTSEYTKRSWGAITEVGAAWITKVAHKIFNIPPFKPEHPLDNEAQWHNTYRDENAGGELSMSRVDADILCVKIESMCKELGYPGRQRDENILHLETLVRVVQQAGGAASDPQL